MPSLHRRRWEEKTVRSHRRRRCELSLRQSQTVFSMLETKQFCLNCGVNTFENKTSSVHTTFQDWTKLFRNFQLQTVLTCLQFSSHRRDRQDTSMFAVWTSHKSVAFKSWLKLATISKLPGGEFQMVDTVIWNACLPVVEGDWNNKVWNYRWPLLSVILL